MGSLTDALYNNMDSSIYPFHMPGHKRQSMEYENDILSCIRGIDVTEIDGLDDLHNASGVIADIQRRCSNLWGSDESRILVNGSSAGVLAGIMTCMCEGGKLLIARNAHKSAYNAINIGRIRAKYIYPETLGKYEICGGVLPSEIERNLSEDEEIKAVYITSPTYEGVISPVNEISEICHKYGVPLIVDAAHGAHFGLYQSFTEKYGMSSAIKNGADIAIESLHKTLPAFTQTGVLHYRRGLINEERLNYYLSVFQSTSPSYILMAGVDRCIDILEKSRKELFAGYEEKLDRFYNKVRCLKNIHVLTYDEVMDESRSAKGFDIGKLVISGRRAGINGIQLAGILRSRYGLETEMCAGGYVLAMTGIMDSREGFDRLARALIEFDSAEESVEKTEDDKKVSYIYPQTESMMTISEAVLRDNYRVKLQDASGMESADFIFSYPPGIPIVAPGEIISDEIIEAVCRMERDGVELRGIEEGKVKVING